MMRLKSIKSVCLLLALSVATGAGSYGVSGAGSAGGEVRFAQPPAPAPASRQVALAIIVNRANPIENLTIAELREYLLAERSRWPSSRKVRVAMSAPGRDERLAVLRLILNMPREQDFQAYFLRAKFSEQVMEQPRELGSAPDMIRFVSNVAGAIGFVRADEVDPSVKVIRVDDLAPGDPGYKLRL